MKILTPAEAQIAVEKALTTMVKNAQEALNETAQEVFQEAQAAVPVKTGRLRDSGKVEEEPIIHNIKENWKTVTTISFDTDYAVDVHENSDSTGYKFLENPINRHATTAKKRVIERSKV